MQASVLFAALADDAPEELESSYASLSAQARKRVKSGATQVLRSLEGTLHTRGRALLEELVPDARR